MNLSLIYNLSLMLKFSFIPTLWSLKANTLLQVQKMYVQNELTWICKGHIRCIERNATIHKRNIHDKEWKIVFCVVYPYVVATWRRECVLIQKLTWYICNVILIHRRILVINLSKKIWDCLQFRYRLNVYIYSWIN